MLLSCQQHYLVQYWLYQYYQYRFIQQMTQKKKNVVIWKSLILCCYIQSHNYQTDDHQEPSSSLALVRSNTEQLPYTTLNQHGVFPLGTYMWTISLSP